MDKLEFTGVLFLLFCIFLSNSTTAQSGNRVDPTYISPLPGSQYIMPGNNIAIRNGEPFRQDCIKDDLLIVSNSRGERHPGTILLSDDQTTLIFNPAFPFDLGDEIHVDLGRGLLTESGKEIIPTSFNFFIASSIVEIDQSFVDTYIRENSLELLKPPNQFQPENTGSEKNELPEGYPEISVLVDNDPPEGHYFFAPYDEWNWYPETEPFVTITDKYGIPVYYRKLETYGSDFKIQPNGKLSYYTYQPVWGHQALDSAFQVTGIYKMGNGYNYTDFHDFLLLENGHYFVMTYDAQLVDMSAIVPGGDPEAIVNGFVMQELDANDNVILQWRSWDHYEITETGPEVDLTEDIIDYVHGNTIELESDTSILLSSRNFHEVTKIHRNTGEMIWRLGGSQNQFEFLGDEGDTLNFSRQHDSRRLPDGRISMYDNGTKRPEPRFSSVPVYELNLENSTATLVERYRREPDYLGIVMGNAYWTPDSTIVIGWGSCLPAITEIDLDGNVLYEMHIDGVSYRAFRYPWETTYFDTDTDSMDFGFVWKEDQKTETILIQNNQDFDIQITGYHLHSDKFIVENEFPVVVPAGSEESLQLTFNPGLAVGAYSDMLTLNSDIDTDDLVQRIAQQVSLEGLSTEGQSLGDANAMEVFASPNPVTHTLQLSFGNVKGDLHIQLFDYTGNSILTIHHGGNNQCLIDMQSLSSGLYFVEIRNTSHQLLNVLKVVKN